MRSSTASSSSTRLTPRRPLTLSRCGIATMATNRLSSGCAEYCGRSPLASDRPKLRPAGEPAGPELHQWFFLESDTEFADEHLLLALAVGDDDALAVVVL